MAAFLSFSCNSIEQLLLHQDINNRQILLLMILKRPIAFQIHWTTRQKIACEELIFKMQMMRWRCKIKDIGTGRSWLFFFFFLDHFIPSAKIPTVVLDWCYFFFQTIYLYCAYIYCRHLLTWFPQGFWYGS